MTPFVVIYMVNKIKTASTEQVLILVDAAFLLF